MINALPFQDPIGSLLGQWAAEISPGSILLRFGLSLLLGAIIGWERSTKRHSAGLRTFMLVFLTGTLAGVLDGSIFLESGRSGIFLFLGAGTIVVTRRNQIKGLTTAVGLWVSVVIGIGLGIGCYTAALAAFAALLCALFWFPSLERVFKNRSNHFEIHLELTNSISLQDFVTVIRRLGMVIDEIEQNPAYVGSGLSVYSISISISDKTLKQYKTHQEIIEALKTLDYVYHIEEMRG